jgi:agmatinase
MSNRIYAGLESGKNDFEKARVLLQSVPFDGTSTWGKGADQGFEAFCDASDNMEIYDIETDSEPYLIGVHILDEIAEYETTQEMLKTGKFLTAFGGEHSISIGIIKAHYEHFENLTVLQMDAHTDLRPEYHGTPYNHACAVYDASKNANLIQVGIRSMDVSEKEHLDYNKVYFAENIMDNDFWMEEALGKMTDNVYITFDLDCFDSSIMPSTGTPEPGGMYWYQVLDFLRRVYRRKNVVGFDIVELAPNPHNPAPNFIAAKLYYKMLAYKFENELKNSEDHD